MHPDPPHDDPEDQLVQRAKAGDFGAFSQLVHAHRTSGLRVATVLLGTAEGSDDIVEASTTRCWQRIDHLQAGRSFRPWWLSNVVNRARNQRRRRQAHLAVRAGPSMPEVSDPAYGDSAVVHAQRQRVVDALNHLSPADRLVLAVRYFEHLSEEGIAEVVNCAPETVAYRLDQATIRLRLLLEASEPAEQRAVAGPMADDRLELILEDVGVHLVVPGPAGGLDARPETGTVSIDTAEPRRHSRRVRTLVVAGIAVLVLVVAAALIRSIRSALETEDSGLPALVEGAEPVAPEDAEDYYGHPLPSTDGLGLGAPDWYAFTPEDGFLFGWEDATTVWVTHTEEPAETRTGQLVDDVDAAQPVPDLGDSAVAIAGDDALSTPVRREPADSVVLWIANGHEFRLESDRDVNDLIEAARTIDPPE